MRTAPTTASRRWHSPNPSRRSAFPGSRNRSAPTISRACVCCAIARRRRWRSRPASTAMTWSTSAGCSRERLQLPRADRADDRPTCGSPGRRARARETSASSRFATTPSRTVSRTVSRTGSGARLCQEASAAGKARLVGPGGSWHRARSLAAFLCDAPGRLNRRRRRDSCSNLHVCGTRLSEPRQGASRNRDQDIPHGHIIVQPRGHEICRNRQEPIARLFAQCGAAVAIHGRDQHALEAVQRAIADAGDAPSGSGLN
jgi:hypothetical protein